MTNAPDDEIVEPFPNEEPDGLLDRLRAATVGKGPLTIAVIAIVGLLTLVCVLVILLFQFGNDDEAVPTTAAAEIETVFDVDSFSYLSISESGAISVSLESPVFVDVTGEQFSVVVEPLPQSGLWSPSPPNPETAVWAYGSIINYIFGLEDTDENRALLDGLLMGEEIVLTTRSGSQFKFEVKSRREVDSDDRDVLAQRSPSVTLLLLDNDPNEPRLVVQGQYVVPDTSSGDETGRMVEMGETAQIEGLQLTVTGSSTLYDRPEIPAGFAFFLVDFQVQNVGAASVGFNSLNMVLTDEFGNQYALNPTAGQVGNNRLLSGSLAVGQSMIATAGYQIPAGLTSPILRWQVSMTNTGSQIQVSIPFHNQLAGDQQVEVQLQRASVSPDGRGLLVVGLITNLSNQLLIVDVPNISLDSAGTIHQMLSTNPGFPWNVPPGQSILFSVTFQRPIGEQAVLTVLNQPYRLTGLR